MNTLSNGVLPQCRSSVLQGGRARALRRSIVAALAVVGSTRIFSAEASLEKYPPHDFPAGEARLVESIPVPPREAPPPPAKPKAPPSVTEKRFDAKLTPAELAALKLPSTPFPEAPPPLGLSRLGTAVENSKFDHDTLDIRGSEGGVRRRSQHGISFVDVDGRSVWSRPLRGSTESVVFVSVLADASIATTLDVGGALLRVSESKEPECAEIEIGEQDGTGAVRWKELGYRVPVDKFDGRQLAQLPLLTLRIDRGSSTWDVFSGFLRIRTGISLGGPVKSGSALRIETGAAGALVCGIVSSEENPLFDDANSDGVDDGLEWMADAASPTKNNEKPKEPAATPVQWHPTLYLLRPLPDSMIKGKSVGE